MLQHTKAASRAATQIVAMTGHALATAIRTRAVSCREVADAYLRQIERHNGDVNAIVALRDADDIRAEADAKDAMLARGESQGWLHGFPQAIKDLSATKGVRTTQGSLLFADSVPERDALFVARMRAAGAIIIGKTNTPEFGLGSQTYNQVYGTTRNAYDRALTAGGSSGGAAAALAMQMLPVADGSDHAGSLRNPAAFNNVYGFRPTLNRVPVEGREICLPGLGVIGPMARSVEDLAQLLAVQSGYDRRSMFSLREDPAQFLDDLARDFAGTRIGWLGDFDGHLAFEPGVLDLCTAAMSTFSDLGCAVEAAEVAFDMEQVWTAWVQIRAWLTGGALMNRYNDPVKRALMKPEAQWEVEESRKLSAHDIYLASAVRADWCRSVARLFERYDYLVVPSAQVFPFSADLTWPREIAGRPMDTYHRWMEVMIPGTMSGCPIANVPAGFDAQGRPMGLQIIAPVHADLACLQLAHAYETASRWQDVLPAALKH